MDDALRPPPGLEIWTRRDTSVSSFRYPGKNGPPKDWIQYRTTFDTVTKKFLERKVDVSKVSDSDWAKKIPSPVRNLETSFFFQEP